MQRAQAKLLRELELLGMMKSLHVREVFAMIPRSAFLPESLAFDAFRNVPLLLPDGGRLSQPMILAFILEQARLQQGNRVLFFDDGSGWEANCIASLVSFSSENSSLPLVFAVESNQKLIATARASSESFGFLDSGILKFFPEDSALLQFAPFDRIISIRKLPEGIPNRLRGALAVGGRIVIPYGESIFVGEKESPENFIEKNFFGFHFPKNFIDEG